jgi:hypothetical protein
MSSTRYGDINRSPDYFTDARRRPIDVEAVHLLSDPELRDILAAASALSHKERKLVLDFIKWRRKQK